MFPTAFHKNNPFFILLVITYPLMMLESAISQKRNTNIDWKRGSSLSLQWSLELFSTSAKLRSITLHASRFTFQYKYPRCEWAYLPLRSVNILQNLVYCTHTSSYDTSGVLVMWCKVRIPKQINRIAVFRQ